MMPQLPTEEVDVDQVLHGRLPNHVDAQLLPDAAAGTICCNQILCLDLIRLALETQTQGQEEKRPHLLALIKNS